MNFEYILLMDFFDMFDFLVMESASGTHIAYVLNHICLYKSSIPSRILNIYTAITVYIKKNTRS